jgi:hypothetical protein
MMTQPLFYISSILLSPFPAPPFLSFYAFHVPSPLTWPENVYQCTCKAIYIENKASQNSSRYLTDLLIHFGLCNLLCFLFRGLKFCYVFIKSILPLFMCHSFVSQIISEIFFHLYEQETKPSKFIQQDHMAFSNIIVNTDILSINPSYKHLTRFEQKNHESYRLAALYNILGGALPAEIMIG